MEKIDITLICPDPDQPRKHFSAKQLHDLKTSIKKTVY